MANPSREYIFARRGTGITDLTKVTLDSGELDIEQATKAGLYKINSSHQVGIATQTEVGLTADRYPVRVIIMNDPAAAVDDSTEVAIRYWTVVDASGSSISFKRKALSTDLAVSNLYKLVPDMDRDLWQDWRALKGKQVEKGFTQAISDKADALFNYLMLTNPDSTVMANALAVYEEIRSLCSAGSRVPYFKVADNAFLIGEPSGRKYASIGTASANRVALVETAACMRVNYLRLKARYPEVDDGLISLCAYSISAMFRFGVYENFEHREYHTVILQQVAASPKSYKFVKAYSPAGIETPEDLKGDFTYDSSSFKLSAGMAERGNMLWVTAGLMHYLFNHTTGGNVATGVLLTILSQSNLMVKSMPMEEQVNRTCLLYETLHPVNKRAIANVFLRKSLVMTHGRSRSAGQIEEFTLDSFALIRTNSYPAGSHKAFICLTALKRVLEAGLGPFLSWADQLDSCIQQCKGILSSGARGHIGAHYYTGESPNIQSSSLDQYLPDLACYLHTFNKGDSLTMSPHMAPDVAKRAGMHWQNMLKDLKAKDVSATSAEIVRDYLAQSSAVHFEFNPEDKSTWAKTAAAQGNALKAIAALFT